MSSTGAITGTPATAGTSTFSAQVADSQSPADTASRSLQLTVVSPSYPPLNITTTTLPNAKRNKNYSRTLAATGGLAPYAWSVVSGALPPGLALDAGTGTISGRPKTIGTFAFTVRARDSQSAPASDTQALSIVVTR